MLRLNRNLVLFVEKICQKHMINYLILIHNNEDSKIFIMVYFLSKVGLTLNCIKVTLHFMSIHDLDSSALE